MNRRSWFAQLAASVMALAGWKPSEACGCLESNTDWVTDSGKWKITEDWSEPNNSLPWPGEPFPYDMDGLVIKEREYSLSIDAAGNETWEVNTTYLRSGPSKAMIPPNHTLEFFGPCP